MGAGLLDSSGLGWASDISDSFSSSSSWMGEDGDLKVLLEGEESVHDSANKDGFRRRGFLLKTIFPTQGGILLEDGLLRVLLHPYYSVL